jgi:hypothetical protein
MTDREDRYCDASAALVEELRTAYGKRVMWGEGDNMKKARTRLGLGPLSDNPRSNKQCVNQPGADLLQTSPALPKSRRI